MLFNLQMTEKFPLSPLLPLLCLTGVDCTIWRSFGLHYLIFENLIMAPEIFKNLCNFLEEFKLNWIREFFDHKEHIGMESPVGIWKSSWLP